MALVENSRKRIGEKQLGVLFDGGKVRRRREWRGVKDTFYYFNKVWLYNYGMLVYDQMALPALHPCRRYH